MSLVIKIPDIFYGFVVGDEETTLHEKFFFSDKTNIFLSIQCEKMNLIQKTLMQQLRELNPTYNFKFINFGQINGNKRITLKIEVKLKPWEQLKLFNL